jgi:hypothetical protein
LFIESTLNHLSHKRHKISLITELFIWSDSYIIRKIFGAAEITFKNAFLTSKREGQHRSVHNSCSTGERTRDADTALHQQLPVKASVCCIRFRQNRGYDLKKRKKDSASFDLPECVCKDRPRGLITNILRQIVTCMFTGDEQTRHWTM